MRALAADQRAMAMEIFATGAAQRRGRSVASLNARTGGLLGIELKYLDEGALGTAMVSSATYTGCELPPTVTASGCIGCPAVGDGASSRDGRQYVIKSIVVEGEVRIPAATETTPDIMPVIHLALVQDTQTNGAAFNSEDVFVVPSAGAQTAPFPQRNLNFIKRFRVVDWVRIVAPQRSMAGDNVVGLDKEGVSCPFRLTFSGAVKVNCSGTTQNVNQVQDNSFNLIGVVDTTLGLPTIYYNARTRFLG